MPPRFSINTNLSLGVNAPLKGCLPTAFHEEIGKKKKHIAYIVYVHVESTIEILIFGESYIM
jgi:hypothetical protein